MIYYILYYIYYIIIILYIYYIILLYNLYVHVCAHARSAEHPVVVDLLSTPLHARP